MATLWNRATPPQYRMLRAIAGAVRNTAHAHQLEMPKNFARSVAKRATGTLTAQWPDVLAATSQRRQEGRVKDWYRAGPEALRPVKGHSKGDRLRLLRRSPIRSLWKRFAAGMWKVKREGTPEQYAAHVQVLKLLDEAQRLLDAATSPLTSNTRGTE
jgi:hypothetical protein